MKKNTPWEIIKSVLLMCAVYIAFNSGADPIYKIFFVYGAILYISLSFRYLFFVIDKKDEEIKKEFENLEEIIKK